jgi:hypothetical protein
MRSACRVDECGHQAFPEPETPESFGHRDAELGCLLLARYDVARFADDPLYPAFGGREHEGDVCALIHASQRLQGRIGEFVERSVEAHPPRSRRQGTNEGLQAYRVVGPDLPQRDACDARRLRGREQVGRRGRNGGHRSVSRSANRWT